jgi:dethiobiotin synthetase
MARGFFVTGTDTGIGKTVVSAALMHHLRRRGPVRYWKPIQTGIEQDDDTAVVRKLGACADAEVRSDGVRLPRPLSPHLSARLAGTTIDAGALRLARSSPEAPLRWVVEGAGGVLVPVHDRVLMIDLMVQFDLPVVVAARSGLGTINHTLLTVDALRRRALHVAGVVMVGELNAENRKAIEEYGEVPVVGELPHLADLTSPALADWTASAFDREGRLEQVER